MQFELLPPVPAVSLIRTLLQIPLFRFVSVDELFRLSTISQQVRYLEGALVQRERSKPEYIQVLVEGRFELASGGDGGLLEPPALLGFQEVLEGTATAAEVRAQRESIALVMDAEEFRSLLSANIELALGLFRMLLESDEEREGPRVTHTERLGEVPRTNEGLSTVDKVLYLQKIPILARATAEELYELAAVTRETPIEADAALFSEGHPASIWLVLSGEIALASPSGEGNMVVMAGDCFGIEETLAAADWSWRARGRVPGTALQIEQEALVELLADRLPLLHSMFSAIFAEGEEAPRR